MTKPVNPLDQLEQIRKLMQESSRFISLSGLSGIMTGTSALIGTAAVYVYLGRSPFIDGPYFIGQTTIQPIWSLPPLPFFIVVITLVLIFAIATSIYFTRRRARHLKQPVWSPVVRRLLINLSIPLVVGGVFILALLRAGLYTWITPITLIFYGFALLQASKYTLRDVQFLGLTEIAIGLIASFNLGYGLECWSLGFGICHIIYGVLMWSKYEKGKPHKVENQSL
ncbi:MAG: hypothetical protein HRU40_09580 [Saprospiraceae bacterium]|nr:hypothetical protein [Saprospiraceae bacterium]